MTATPRPSDKYIPWYIVLFFALQAALFAWFIYIAQTTHTGVVTEEPYKKGLSYNKTIEKAAAQDALGFISSITQKSDKIVFTLHDRHGAGISGAKATLSFFRPAHDGIDFTLPMTDIGDGVYEAAYSLPEKGLWELRIHAKTGGTPYQASKRMVLE
jgi:nitrogen fixation protein FixH